jgi:hypothetical protein
MYLLNRDKFTVKEQQLQLASAQCFLSDCICVCRFVTVLISLVVADRTYMKMAKNLIVPEFPGPVLKQFGTMVESHMENYRR